MSCRTPVRHGKESVRVHIFSDARHGKCEDRIAIAFFGVQPQADDQHHGNAETRGSVKDESVENLCFHVDFLAVSFV